MKHKRLYISISIITSVFFTILISNSLWLEALARFVVIKDEVSPSDAIIVLGGGGQERIWSGVELYRSGYGKWIIITGMEQKLPGLTTTWPQLAMKEAVSLGVPERAIILEERPTSTYEDAIFTKEVMLIRGIKSAIVVSSPYHMRRARMVFKKVFKNQKDISLQFLPSEESNFRIHRWWTREHELISIINEYCKLIFYFFKYII